MYKYNVFLNTLYFKISLFSGVFIGLCLYQAYVISNMLQLLQNTFNKLAQKCDTKNCSTADIFSYYNLTDASFDIFLSSIPKKTLPIICPLGSHSYKNSSKAEIIFCKLLSRHHRKYCQSTPFRWVTLSFSYLD